MRVDGWGELYRRGDWILEKRHQKDKSSSTTFLCVIGGDRKEDSVEVPPDLEEILVHGGAKIKDSYDWE